MSVCRLALLCLLMLALPLQGLAAVRAAECAHRPGAPQAPGLLATAGPAHAWDGQADPTAHHGHHGHGGHAAPAETASDALAGAATLSSPFSPTCPHAGAASAPCDSPGDAPCGTCAACCMAAVLPPSVAAWSSSRPDEARSAPQALAWPAVTPAPLERPPRTTSA